MYLKLFSKLILPNSKKVISFGGTSFFLMLTTFYALDKEEFKLLHPARNIFVENNQRTVQNACSTKPVFISLFIISFRTSSCSSITVDFHVEVEKFVNIRLFYMLFQIAVHAKFV